MNEFQESPAEWPHFTISGTRKEFIIQTNTMAGRINNLFIPVGVPGSDRMLWSGLTGPGPAGFSRLSSSVLYFLEPSGQLLTNQGIKRKS